MRDKVRVKASTGVYVGRKYADGLQEFLGIQYAKPAGRWKRAQKLEASDEEIDALFDKPAPHGLLPDEDWPCGFPPVSEFPFFLNVWAMGGASEASAAQGNKPVYVFIHGGSFQEGSARTDCYGGVYCGDEFVRDNPDIVFVSIDYRLGLFGSLDLSELDAAGEYKDSQNLQIYDMMRALEWIHENIAAFGGDPERVTVGGQSAGSYAIFCLLTIPEAMQWFRGAICESSAPTVGPIRTVKYPEHGHKIAREFFERTGAKSLQEALALDAQVVCETGNDIFFTPGFGETFGPCADDVLIPRDVEGALGDGRAKHVTVMSGSVCGEYATLLMGHDPEWVRARIARDASAVTDEDIAAFVANYPERSEAEAYEDLYNDIFLRLRQYSCTDALAKGGSPVYEYYIDFTPQGSELRAQHCIELFYISGKPEQPVYLDAATGQKTTGDAPDFEFGRAVQASWANFVRNLNPNNEHLGCEWPQFTLDGRETMVLGHECKAVNEARHADMEIVRKYQR